MYKRQSLDAQRLLACLVDRKPGEVFLADANGGLQLDHARRLFALLPPDLNIILEAPCATWVETLKLRDFSPYPIMLDELVQTDGDVALAIHLNACDSLNLKLGKQGGLSRAKQQLTMAQAAGLTVSIQDTWGGHISLAAILHLAHATPPDMLRGALDTRPLVGLQLATVDLLEEEGGLRVSSTPGLGVTPKEAALGASLAHWH